MTFATDLQAAKDSGRAFRTEFDCTSNVKRVVYLSDDELAARDQLHVASAQSRANALETRSRIIALKALDDERLLTAASDPEAPQEVKDYAALISR